MNYVIKLKQTIFVPIQGNRTYDIENTAVLLEKKDIEKLKGFAKSSAMDSIFVSTALSMVFTDNVLKISSAGGRQSNYSKKSHAALNRNKLLFVEGNRNSFQVLNQNRCIIESFIIFFPDLFAKRVKYSGIRKKNFTKFVNKKCNNLRRK